MNMTTRDFFYRDGGPMTRGLINMLLNLPRHLRDTCAIEIGSFIGESTNILSLFFKHVYCIDPHGDDTFSGYNSEKIKELFKRNTEGRNITHYNAKAEDIHETFQDGIYGFVYIDGGHVYPCVSQDIKNYLPKIMPGGWIGGHDYDCGIELCAGVKQAVDEAFGQPDFWFEDYSWLVKKK